MEHPPDLPCELLALDDAQVAAKVTTTREGVAPIFSASVSHLGVALGAFLYASPACARAYCSAP